MLAGLAALPDWERHRYMKAMRDALDESPEETRQLMTQALLAALADLPADERRRCMLTMDAIVQGVA